MIGGGLGAVSRYGISLLAARFFGIRFPWGTLIVNLSGCFLIGFCFAVAERSTALTNPSTRLFLVTGFLGAMTTFSTFALETVTAAGPGIRALPLINLLANNLLGLAMVVFGMWTGGR
jgi:fluoride exporter